MTTAAGTDERRPDQHRIGRPGGAVVGYWRAVRVGAQVFVSGTAGDRRPRRESSASATRMRGGPGDRQHRRGARARGATLIDVVRTRINVVDMAHWEAVGRAHGEAFGAIRPASTLVEVSALMAPELLVESRRHASSPRHETHADPPRSP